MSDITRTEHLRWCKERAIAYLDAGDLQNAVTSMGSDMRRHPKTDSPLLAFLFMAGMADAQRGDSAAVRKWVEGFN